MSSELQAIDKNRDIISFDGEAERLIKSMIVPPGSTAAEIGLFLYQCRKTGLDPLAKQIYMQKRAGKLVIITGVDGYRLIADRTGAYAGSDDPVFEEGEKYPRKATITVYKIVGGVRCPYTASARWEAYYPGDGDVGRMWRKMPHHMLGKCAETLALRKAFPAELSGINTKEEIDQIREEAAVEKASAIEAAVRAPQKATPIETIDPIFNKSSKDDEMWFGSEMAKTVINDEDGIWWDIASALDGRPRSHLVEAISEVVR